MKEHDKFIDDKDTTTEPSHHDADEILLDVWEHYSHVITRHHERWAGGLSVLESVEAYLKQRGLLNAKGLWQR